MTKIVAEILRDAALRPTGIKVKNLEIDYEYYPSGAVSKVILSGRRASLPRLFEVLNMIYPRDVSVSVKGSEYYDTTRDPETIWQHFVGFNTGPHATTPRWDYTVPLKHLAYLEMCHLNLIRRTAAGTAGLAFMNLQYSPNQQKDAAPLLLVDVPSNTVGDRDSVNLGHSLLLFAGDVINLTTTDLSTGGTFDIVGTAKFTEFDA